MGPDELELLAQEHFDKEEYLLAKPLIADADIVLDLVDGHNWLITSDNRSILEELAARFALFNPEFISDEYK